MKRSMVNKLLEDAKQLLSGIGFALPEFAYWGLSEWEQADTETIQKTMLGWDVTDFGCDDFYSMGAVLFTIRNGELKSALGTPYAEKIIIIPDGGRLPLHCHKTKTEDIINRGGGTFWIQLYLSKNDGQVDRESEVAVFCDGIKKTFGPGERIEISKGNSITLTPGLYHVFGASNGDTVVGEVSSVNDDITDNYFAETVSRFSSIEEDEPVLHPLCNEYERLFGN